MKALEGVGMDKIALNVKSDWRSAGGDTKALTSTIGKGPKNHLRPNPIMNSALTNAKLCLVPIHVR